MYQHVENQAERFQRSDSPWWCLAGPTGNGSALSLTLDENSAAAVNLGTIKPGQVPSVAGSGAGLNIYIYRPPPQVKAVAFQPLSVAGANNETVRWQIGLYSMAKKKASGTIKPAFLISSWDITFTLGLQNLAAQTEDPFDGAYTFASNALRFPDTVTTINQNDFGDFAAVGAPRLFYTGFNGADKGGLVFMDLSFGCVVAAALITKAASSIQELLGIGQECS